jgi:RimJ/RimL family protein N-acetyltransferase
MAVGRGSLTTARLTLRRLTSADMPALVAALNDYDVSKWLTVVPYPYTDADARAFLDHIADAPVLTALGIFADGRFAGVVGAGDGLGYWLARAEHAKGYMTEAAAAVTAQHFATTDSPVLTSGYFEGNAASARVLDKLGFVPDGQTLVKSRAQGAEVTLKKVVLTREAWEARHGH